MRGAWGTMVAVAIVVASSGQAGAQRDKAAAHFRQGEAYMRAEQYSDAAAEYEKAYAALPKPGFLFNIGLAYELAGNHDKAVEYYRRYLRDDSDGDASEETRARLLKLERAAAEKQERERQAAAGEEAKRAQAEAHTRAEQVVAAARHRLAAGDTAGAIEEFRRAREIEADPERWFDIADAYLKAGNTVEAKVHFESYLAEAPAGPHNTEARRHVDEIEATIARQRSEAAAKAARDAAVSAAAAARGTPRDERLWSVGLKAGVVAWDSPVVGAMGEPCELSNPPGPSIYALGTFWVIPRASLQVEVGLLQQSGGLSCGMAQDRAADRVYFLVPVLARFAVVREPRLSLEVYAGAALAHLLGTTDTVDATGGASAVAGLELGWSGLVVDLRFERASADATFTLNGNQLKIDHTNALHAQIGYRFR